MMSYVRGEPFRKLMRTQFNRRNEQIHSLLDNQLNGRPHMIHITRKEAMTEIRIFKEGAKTRHQKQEYHYHGEADESEKE